MSLQNVKDYFLENYLPTTPAIERELWFREEKQAQRFIEIMKDYAGEIIEECEGCVTNWEDIAGEISDYTDEVSVQNCHKIDKVIMDNVETIEKEIRKVYYQI